MADKQDTSKGTKLRAGGMEEATLRAVLHQEGEGYGVSIKNAVEEALGKTLTFGGTYTTLDRLEEKGFVTSTWGEPTAERGGKKKQFFAITSEGMIALEDVERATSRMRQSFLVPFPVGRKGEVA